LIAGTFGPQEQLGFAVEVEHQGVRSSDDEQRRRGYRPELGRYVAFWRA
jgi:hypothetical protein